MKLATPQPFFPGDKVLSDFAKTGVFSEYTVNECVGNQKCESGWRVLTKCGLWCDSHWFRPLAGNEELKLK